MNDFIYDAEGACKGRYSYTRGPIWVHMGVDMGSRERAVKGLESRAVSARVTELMSLFLVKHVVINMSCGMRFPTMWYVRPAKPQISLHICAV